jgi:hypothetical protein
MSRLFLVKNLIASGPNLQFSELLAVTNLGYGNFW